MENPEHDRKDEKTKHEKDQEKRAQREQERKQVSHQEHRRSTTKKIGIYVAAALLVIGIGYGLFSWLGGQPTTTGNVSAEGIPDYPIHWHPDLRIIINGEPQIIPVNVGISPSYHAPVHTHTTDGVLHIESISPTAEILRLGYFFEKVWNKRLTDTCIFEYCNEGDNVVRVFVDGKQITDPTNHIMRDKQSILVLYGPMSEDASKYYEGYVPPTPGDIRM
jgi:hypothetical protein